MRAHGCTSIPSFLEISSHHEIKRKPLRIDLQWHDPSGSVSYDAVVIGCGPSGLRLAEQASMRGVRVCCVDPSPLLPWPNHYGIWADEFEAIGLQACLDNTWPAATIFLDDHNIKHLDRRYARASRQLLKAALLESCASHGVKFHKGKVWRVEHTNCSAIVACSDGRELKASIVVDASGFGSTFLEYGMPPARRNQAFQVAYGVLAEVDRHPYELDKMVLMDWRDGHLRGDSDLKLPNTKAPTFLYAMPFDSNLIFLEETSLVSRPAMSCTEIKKKMATRLQHLGVTVKRVIEVENCLIPMGGALPRIPQSTVGFGGAAGLVHPTTGYMVAAALALAPAVAEAMVECLGSERMTARIKKQRMWGSVWTSERRRAREYYCFGIEALLRMDLEGTKRFFEAFFALEPHSCHAYLSSSLSMEQLVRFSLGLSAHMSNEAKVDLFTKCLVPLGRMVGNMVLIGY